MSHTTESGYYIPKTITIGQFGNSAFVTCKFRGAKWIAPTIFERLCKFKPHTQRDSTKQLKKIITNAVVELPNDPVEGFKFVKSNDDIYKMKNSWRDRGDIVLQDPRGFDIGLPEAFFWNMLKTNSYNMKDGVIAGRYAYMWHEYSNRFELVNADTAEYAKCLAASKDIVKIVDNTQYLKPSQIEVGKTYLHTNGEAWMYLGIHDTYSTQCHLDAFDAKTYEYVLDELLEDRTDLTTHGKMVFYNTDVAYNKYWITISKVTSADANPYVTRSSASKLFLREVNDADIASKRMYNSAKICTYQNVKDDMKHSLFFNKIDLKRCTTEKEPLSFGCFESQFGYKDFNCKRISNALDFDDFPFCGYDRCNIIDTRNFGCISLRTYTIASPKYQQFFFQQITHNTVYPRLVGINEQPLNCSIEECYDKLKPLVNIFYLENGEKVGQCAARCLRSKEERHYR